MYTLSSRTVNFVKIGFEWKYCKTRFDSSVNFYNLTPKFQATLWGHLKKILLTYTKIINATSTLSFIWRGGVINKVLWLTIHVDAIPKI